MADGQGDDIPDDGNHFLESDVGVKGRHVDEEGLAPLEGQVVREATQVPEFIVYACPING